jgi:hypothetical protein
MYLDHIIYARVVEILLLCKIILQPWLLSIYREEREQTDAYQLVDVKVSPEFK